MRATTEPLPSAPTTTPARRSRSAPASSRSAHPGAAPRLEDELVDPAALERRAGGQRRVQQHRVEQLARAGQRRAREGQQNAGRPGRHQAHPAQRRGDGAHRAQQAEPVERLDRAAVEVLAADLAARKAGPLDDVDRPAGAGQQQRGDAAGGAAADHQRVGGHAAPSLSVMRKNGSRRTRAVRQPLARASASASPGV